MASIVLPRHRSAAFQRQANRAAADLRRSGRDRHRECAAVRRGADAHEELSQSLDDLRAAQDRLVQTEKLASLGQLTAGIAHEIKNPLNFVNNFSALSVELTDELNDVLKQAVAQRQASAAEVDELTGLLKDNLEKVVQHGKRADSIVKNMLLHSREGSGEHRPADINALVDESLNLAYHGARAEKPQFNVTLQRNFDPKRRHDRGVSAGNHPRVPEFDLERFLCREPSARPRTAATGFEPVAERHHKRTSATSVEIRIRDNGTGIPAEVKEKMFNPFFTTKPAGEGTGLGLSMSHDIIVKQHGGTIDVETEPGRIYRIQDCFAEDEHCFKQEQRLDVSVLVLVVDDEPDVEALFRQQFRRDLRAQRFIMDFANFGGGCAVARSPVPSSNR